MCAMPNQVFLDLSCVYMYMELFTMYDSYRGNVVFHLLSVFIVMPPPPQGSPAPPLSEEEIEKQKAELEALVNVRSLTLNTCTYMGDLVM